MKWINPFKKANKISGPAQDTVELEVICDFGFTLQFAGMDENHIPFEKLANGKEIRKYPDMFPKRDIDVSLRETEDHIRFFRLDAHVPIFDSGDSMYDSWHCLYLIEAPRHKGYDAVYATGGWCGPAKIIGYKKLLKMPSELEALKMR